MIFRILMLLLLIGFIYWVLKKSFAEDDPAKRRNPQREEPEDMLICETCGVHTPRSMTVQVDGKTYCCHEHAPPGKPSDSADDR